MSSTGAHPEARRFGGGGLRILPPTALEACRGGAASATLHLGGHLSHDPLSPRKRPPILSLSELHRMCRPRTTATYTCLFIFLPTLSLSPLVFFLSNIHLELFILTLSVLISSKVTGVQFLSSKISSVFFPFFMLPSLTKCYPGYCHKHELNRVFRLVDRGDQNQKGYVKKTFNLIISSSHQCN